MVFRCISEGNYGLPLKRELEFTIELVPGAVPNSKTPYRMNIMELNELNPNQNKLLIKIILDPLHLLRDHLLFLLKRKKVLFVYV